MRLFLPPVFVFFGTCVGLEVLSKETVLLNEINVLKKFVVGFTLILALLIALVIVGCQPHR
jgi:hypothetical protein